MKTIILPAVLYECETWSLFLTKDQRLRAKPIYWAEGEIT
jgi:hypothetical protein